MSDDTTIESLEIVNIKMEYVDEVIRQYTNNGWELVKRTSQSGQGAIEGQITYTIFFKRSLVEIA